MDNKTILANSPIANYDFSFDNYLNKRKAQINARMDGNGIPNYAYKPDYDMRKRLDAVPGLFHVAKNISATMASRYMQQENMRSLAVGPNQFPEVYQIGCDCAKKLGIAIPNIYIQSSEVVNAYTFATADSEPFIVVTSLLLERMTLGELKAVIGHECGHIQNCHTTYNVINSLLIQGSLAGIIIGDQLFLKGLLTPFYNLLTSGIQMLLSSWSRAAEVTADRAAMICCDNLEDVYSVDKKFLYGAVKVEDKIDTNLTIQSLKEQMEMTMNNPNRFRELMASHPLPIKRIFAELEFAECETFYNSWRPDLKIPGCIMRSKEEVDRRCKRYIDVNGKGDIK
ncbi:MAG: M48 family metallopeptidase [Clostridia bacterium]|nr:M48 family metallopeptidase [Clostridia bacterium]